MAIPSIAIRSRLNLLWVGEAFPTDRTEARRAFGHVLSMVETSALLHLRHRQRNDDGRIVAEAFDYEVARSLLTGPMSRSIGGAVSDSAKRLWQRLTWPTGSFTSTEVYKREKCTDRIVRVWLGELANRGFIKVVDSGRGKATVYEIVSDA